MIVRPKDFVSLFLAPAGWMGAQIAFTGSAADCRMIYGLLAGAVLFGVSGAWVWLPHLPVQGATAVPDPYPVFPPQPVYYGPVMDPVWAAGRSDRARELWLQGEDAPPTDWFGAR